MKLSVKEILAIYYFAWLKLKNDTVKADNHSEKKNVNQDFLLRTYLDMYFFEL